MQTLGPLDVEGIDFAFDDQPDLHAVLARLRERRPYAIVPFAGVRGVLLLTDELVRAAFRDETTFPAAPTYAMTTEPVFGRTVLSMSGAEHRASRSIVSAPLRRTRIRDHLQPVIEPVVHQLIDRFAARGSADLVAEFTHRYSLLIISRLLGLPVDDEARIHRWAQAMIRYPFDPQAAITSAAEFTAYVAPLVAARRREPGDDMISLLVTETTEDGESFSDADVSTFLRMLFPLGADTTTLALGNILSALLNHPEQWDLLRSDPQRHLQSAVWEGLRWEPAVGMLPRACPEAATWHGIDIPALTPMIFAINAANRDPAVYPRPHDVDITRNAMPTVSFGQGHHSCIGNWLANAELVTALGALVERLPDLALDPRQAETSAVTSQVGTTLRGPNALHVTFTPAGGR
ncbi:cytochrome P450 [Mycolicibacterium madagascariense]|uniref:Cytochrome P450 n=1 Tax=Mycolicibacterium madagascariense TaxID=212765 RepID=A0A7I7XAD8_9MYCO|nr:cytochrome P450 [Mycolicibacterium madagascariense]MCV7013398.1 cytochrome P450 [Mycolicibacterium madagascariense]BBZ25883.1 cytochrome P450 [Mycolicibacterium madagascariense]